MAMLSRVTPIRVGDRSGLFAQLMGGPFGDWRAG